MGIFEFSNFLLDDDSKSVANSEALEVSTWTAAIMTPSPTKNEADKINSSGSAKARPKKANRPSKAIQEGKDCGVGRLFFF